MAKKQNAQPVVDPKKANIKSLFEQYRSTPKKRRSLKGQIIAAVEAQKPKNVKTLPLNWDEFQIVSPETMAKREERSKEKYSKGKCVGVYFVQ